MQSDHALKPIERRPAEIGAGLDPLVHPVTDAHASTGRIDVAATVLRDLNRGQEQFGIALGAETALVGLPMIGLADSARDIGARPTSRME